MLRALRVANKVHIFNLNNTYPVHQYLIFVTTVLFHWSRYRKGSTVIVIFSHSIFRGPFQWMKWPYFASQLRCKQKNGIVLHIQRTMKRNMSRRLVRLGQSQKKAFAYKMVGKTTVLLPFSASRPNGRFSLCCPPNSHPKSKLFESALGQCGHRARRDKGPHYGNSRALPIQLCPFGRDHENKIGL